jgi:hypothetical protein
MLEENENHRFAMFPIIQEKSMLGEMTQTIYVHVNK